MGGLVKSAFSIFSPIVSSLAGALMKNPQQPPPPPPPAAPVLPQPTMDAPDKNTAQANIDAAAQASDQQDAERKKRGRAATILTGDLGAGTPTTATKQLLGD